jgi:hypothetical protein
LVLVVSLSLALTVAGCGGTSSTGAGSSADTRDDLAGLGGAYHAFHDRNKQGPKSVDDLIQMLPEGEQRNSFTTSQACKRLQSGDYVLNPGLSFRDIKDLSRVAILYEKDVPTKGGLVVLGDASVVEMKPADFASLNVGP